MNNKHNEILRIYFEKLKYLRYSKNTITTYTHYCDKFLNSVNKYHYHLTGSDFQNYLNNYNFSSASQQNQIISAIKFLYDNVLKRKYSKIDFTRPRKENKIPLIIDQQEMIAKIKAINNLKHKAIIWLAFSTGMRVSEVINLRIKDVDSERMIIHIKNAKGRKDRLVKLTSGTLSILRLYFKKYKPDTLLFNGSNSLKYSASSCNKIVKKYILPEFHFHLLRHSFACSVLENGTDINILQNALGHNDIKTSARYIHLTKNAIQRTNAPI